MKDIKINIDGKEIITKEGKSVLDCALESGIYIPHLCHHPDLPELGACRLCVVENNGEIVTSCTLKAEDGMVIKTQGEKINKKRQLAMELILAAHPEECSTCPKYGKCELQVLIQYLGVGPERLRMRVKPFPKNTSNPLFDHDMTRCVLCGRCARVCQKVRKVNAIDYQKKNGEVYIGSPHEKLLIDADCKFCGACVEICPTGALMDKKELIDLNKNKETALVPCRNTCPAGTDIPTYIRLVNEGKYSEATAVIREKLPIPKILGHICSHPCEAECRRGNVNEPISIRELKLFAVENDEKEIWKKNRKQLPPTGKKVGIIGAGPAGLSAAYYLKKQGHDVTVYEALPYVGGMTRVGIPEYRLPRDVIEEEANLIKEIGVEIVTNKRIENFESLLNEGYDVVLAAIGAHKGIRLPIEGNDLDGVLVNTDFLRAASLNEELKIGDKVIVLGGGNVAFDCARTAVRLGAKNVHLACLENEENIPASKDEVKAGIEEDITIHYSKSFAKILGEEGKVTGIEFVNIESMSFDENRRLTINLVEGSNHTLEADQIIFATGQRPEINEGCGFELGRGNTIVVNDMQETNKKGIFAAGDAIYGTNSVVKAVASGRDAAKAIDKFLGGDGNIEEHLIDVDEPNKCIGKKAGFGYEERIITNEVDVNSRKNNFSRAENGFTCEQANKESSRCLQCDLRLGISKPKTWNDFAGITIERGND
ncbi:NADPH-dependent glutamate synthase beta subunit-like oxidoreductase [Clostridium saccharoperbutylacetonicum]|uniref:NADH-quinone oxidoreductase subunit G 2 n=2 Tax=Clostridium TaxID=1485 RepID=M1MKN8_9CLOT|nr:FAD-dependent oxidoreductase [Clostridium saccharoperbutylacetonicum]AGF58509.1 NADH-quinone oxidoreductase subunit G 2 [Clostridium saccharoperbutylacetonicum N1-4(HMT)]NRT60713.1 NADPH-dependent glutamate synthase beta subunit-like oxidoreductase [Clostridium saccharoperbutylacetonicum]NSB24027.1 NADPH-dependent glutamate synthase beta subunit-like oxidoreductase [Clostridium saccharoperbutylacetonicum]NSB43404.1 NADPH-dependent glutamate synthase beta subunit-like oxidoreductase [Clostrid